MLIWKQFADMLVRRLWHRPQMALIATIVLFCLGLCITLTAICGPTQILVPGTEGYAVTGAFAVKETLPTQRNPLRAVAAQKKDIILWRSSEGSPKSADKLVSPPFRSPAILGLFVFGWPHTPGNKLLIERIGTDDQINLKLSNMGGLWTELQWIPPLNWYGRPIRLVAIDEHQDNSGRLGVSPPLQTSFWAFLSGQIGAIAIVPLYTVYFVLFLLPGLLLARLIMQRYELHPALTVTLAIAGNALIGYITFWVYFFNNNLGVGFSLCILLVTLGSIALLSRRQTIATSFFKTQDVVFPLLLMLTVGLAYLLVLYTTDLGVRIEALAEIRFGRDLPPDNRIPQIFAEKLYSGQDPRPLLGDWLSSDRPPLQVGIILLQLPLSRLCGSDSGLHYQILSTIAQCSWIPAMWSLCRLLGFSGWRIAQVMAFSICSGFFFFNTVYVWPKLLAAAMVILAFTLLAPAVWEARRPSTAEIGLAGIAAALGMLSHGAVVFTLPGIVLMLVKPRSFPGVRSMVVGLLMFGLLLAPWSAYQTFYEPPGNRLLKWHLAGVIPIDSRSTLQAIQDSYQNSSIAQIANNKWENLKILVDSPITTVNGALMAEVTRVKESFHPAYGLGVLNIGWFVWFAMMLYKRLKLPTETKRIHLVLGVSVFSLCFWILIMFGPATTVIHQGSYATMMLLFAGLAGLLTYLPRPVVYAALAFQTVAFVMNWIIATTFRSGDRLPTAPNLFLIVLTLVLFIGIMRIFRQLVHVSFIEEADANHSLTLTETS